MKITIIGGGSAGLAAGIGARQKLGADVTILERQAAGEAPGLGVALLRFAFNELRMAGLEGFTTQADGFAIGSEIGVFAGEHGRPFVRQTRRNEQQYWGVRRSTLLSFLTGAAEKAGVRIEYATDVTPDRIRAERADADLLVGADGAGSLVRGTYADEFMPTMAEAESRYAWLELEGRLTDFMFGYVLVPGAGLIRITAYPHSPTECSAIVTHSAGLSATLDAPGMLDADGNITETALALLNDYFAAGLDGRRLKGTTRWRRFRATSCGRAASGNAAIVGDAFATVHYETGWGTSAALQESRILMHILELSLRQRGESLDAALGLFNRKALELSSGLVSEALRVMRAIDSQAALFAELGAARFLEIETP
ncbi:MAG: FAD-dependent monooxygenase [Bauldia sp.]